MTSSTSATRKQRDRDRRPARHPPPGKVDPALDGAYRVTLRDGSEVEVTPAFEMLRERLADYDPPAPAGSAAPRQQHRGLAHRVAEAKRVTSCRGSTSTSTTTATSWSARMALLMALTGNFGRRGPACGAGTARSSW